LFVKDTTLLKYSTIPTSFTLNKLENVEQHKEDLQIHHFRILRRKFVQQIKLISIF